MKTSVYLLFASCLISLALPSAVFAQNTLKTVQDVADKYIGLDSSRLRLSGEKNMVVGFWKALQYLRDYDQKQKELTGKAGFGFENNQTPTDKLFTLNAGIQLGRGIYPGEFTFNTKVDLTVRNGKFQENVSDIFLSYDYFPLEKNKLWLENFVFLNRFKDAFIGIEQRYEAGGGVIFELWTKKKLVPVGRDERKKMLADTFSQGFLDKKWPVFLDSLYRRGILKGRDTNDLSILRKAQQRTQAALITQYSKLRLGLLIGVYIESEQGMPEDSIQLPGSPGRTFFSGTPLNTIKPRWEARPTIVYRPGKRLEISLKPYFKFPMPWTWYETVKSDNAVVFSKKFDFHADLRSEVKLTLTDDNQNKKVSVGLEHRMLYDASPPRIYLKGQTGADGKPVLLSARNRHEINRLKVEVEF